MLPGQRKILEKGEIFGEIGALSRYPVSATVRAGGPAAPAADPPARRCACSTAASKEFKKFLDTRYRERTLARHLRNVALFARMDERVHRASSRSTAELLSFEPGQVIVRGGRARRTRSTSCAAAT